MKFFVDHRFLEQNSSVLRCLSRSEDLNKVMFLKCLVILVSLSVAFETVNGNNATLKRVRRNNGACGIPSQSTSLIIRGNDFPRGTWPWMVALMQKATSPPRLFCGGVLVSSTKILTGKLKIPVWIANKITGFHFLFSCSLYSEQRSADTKITERYFVITRCIRFE